MIINRLRFASRLLFWCIKNLGRFLTNGGDRPLTIITASDRSHQKSLRNLLLSLESHEPLSKVIVFDLGLEDDFVKGLNGDFPRLIIRPFPYENFPNSYDINVAAGNYAWKPASIELAKPWEGDVVWFDAGNVITGRLSFLRKTLRKHPFFSPYSVGKIVDWTYPSVLVKLTVDNKQSRQRNLAANVIAFDSTNPQASDLMQSWIESSKNLDLIAPAGSSRMNHRQDQSLLSILAYKSNLVRYGSLADFPRRIFKILVHQDAD